MKRTIAITCLFFLLIGVSSAFAVGEEASDFTLSKIKGGGFRLSDHLGDKVILITFWMSWCKPCLVEMPQLEKLYKKYGKDGFMVVSINCDDPSGIAKAKMLVRQKRITYPVLLDSETRVAKIYNPNKSFPYTVLIDKNKKVVHEKAGFKAGDLNVLEKKIKDLLAAKE